MTTYYVNLARYTEQYIAQIESIFGERPVFMGEVIGREKFSRQPWTYASYTLEKEPSTTDEKWIVGNNHEEMLQAGLIGEQKSTSIEEVNVQRKSASTTASIGVVFQTWSSVLSSWSAKVLLVGQVDDVRVDGFKSEAEAWQFIDKKYPGHERASSHEEYIERQRKNLAALGTDFKSQAMIWR